MSDRLRVDVVIPTVGRPSLGALLHSLAHARGPRIERVLIVHDRPEGADAVRESLPDGLSEWVTILQGRGAGPASARNIGWRASDAEWIAFLDDDVVVEDDWLEALHADLRSAAFTTAGMQGRIVVPLPEDRPPTDWERNVARLETARWATADLAYRRLALETVGGFDERFPRAYREDADLGMRLVQRGWTIEAGRRATVHPVRPTDRWTSVRLQAGNADDALMRALHGADWRGRAGVPRGRRSRHLAIAAAAAGAIAGLAARRRTLAALAGAGCAAGVAEFAWARLRPGPRTREEVATILGTSVVLPFAATAHWARGWWRVWREERPAVPVVPRAVLFDRDGTLVEDIPYNGDPAQVRLRPGAEAAVRRLHMAGIPMAVVSNQSGIARGRTSPDEVTAVNARVEELLGASLPFFVCPHSPDDGCDCRKPAPGLVHAAACELGMKAAECLVIGDIGTDVEAARTAGARGILVPTPNTRVEEIRAAPEVAMTLPAAVELLLEGRT